MTLPPLLMLAVLSFLQNAGRCSSDCVLSDFCVDSPITPPEVFRLDCSNSIPTLHYQTDNLYELTSLFVVCIENGVEVCQDVSPMFMRNDLGSVATLLFDSLILTEPHTTCTATICYDEMFSHIATVNTTCTFTGLALTEEPAETSIVPTSTATMSTAVSTITPAAPSPNPVLLTSPPPQVTTTGTPSPKSDISEITLTIALLLPAAVIILLITILILIFYLKTLRKRKLMQYRLTYPYFEEEEASGLPDIDALSLSSFFTKLQISQSVCSIFDRLEHNTQTAHANSKASSCESLENKMAATEAESSPKSLRNSDEDSAIALDTQGESDPQLSIVNEYRPESPYVKAEDIIGTLELVPPEESSEELFVDITEVGEEESPVQITTDHTTKKRPSILHYKVSESDSGYILSTPTARTARHRDDSETIPEGDSITDRLVVTLEEAKSLRLETVSKIESRRHLLQSQSSNASFMLGDVYSIGNNDDQSTLKSLPILESLIKPSESSEVTTIGDDSEDVPHNESQVEQEPIVSEDHSDRRGSSRTKPEFTSQETSTDSTKTYDYNGLAYLPSDVSEASKSDGYIPSNSSGYATDELPYLPSDVSIATSGPSLMYYPCSSGFCSSDEQSSYIPSDMSTGTGYNTSSLTSSGYIKDKLSNLHGVPNRTALAFSNFTATKNSLPAGDHLYNTALHSTCTSRSQFTPSPDGYVMASDSTAIDIVPSSCAQVNTPHSSESHHQ